MTDGAGRGPGSPLFRKGIEHFDAGEYYEAHEVWEDLWRTLSGNERLFLQALIQASVALHHLEKGNRAGARQLARATFAKLSLLPSSMWGLDCEALAADFSERVAHLSSATGDADAPPPGLPRMTLRVDSALP
jgi:predicted metal-dependent hydrolase